MIYVVHFLHDAFCPTQSAKGILGAVPITEVFPCNVIAALPVSPTKPLPLLRMLRTGPTCGEVPTRWGGGTEAQGFLHHGTFVPFEGGVSVNPQEHWLSDMRVTASASRALQGASIEILAEQLVPVALPHRISRWNACGDLQRHALFAADKAIARGHEALLETRRCNRP